MGEESEKKRKLQNAEVVVDINLQIFIRVFVSLSVMDTEELIRKRKAISIRGEQTNKISLTGRKSVKGEQIAACCLVGKILHQRGVNLEGLRSAMLQIWRTNREVKIESLGNNIFMFKFDLEADKKRVMGGGPWHFDQALIVLTEPKGIGDIANQPFTHTSFWI